MEKKPIANTVAGAIISALIIVVSILVYFTGLWKNQVWSWVSYLILVVGIAYFVFAFAKANGNRLTFGNLFAYGFKTTAAATIIVLAFNIVFVFIFPEFRDKYYELARQKMEEQGKLTEDQINQAIEMTRKFFWLGLVLGSLFMFAIFGAIGSLVGAAISKKQAASPFDNPA